jgi:hypothetical protein
MSTVRKNRASYDIGPHKGVYVGTDFVIASGERLQMLRYFRYYKDVLLVLVRDSYAVELKEHGYAYAVVARAEDVELVELDNITSEKAKV